MFSRLIMKLDACINIERNPIGVKSQPSSFGIIVTKLDIITRAADFFKTYEPAIGRNREFGLLSLVLHKNAFRIMLRIVIKDILRAGRDADSVGFFGL